MDAALTVIMPTWNKAKYIREALDSVFMQKTSYPYRVIVADDCSTDGTLDIVAEYEQAHPGVITVLRSDRNQKLFRNIVRVYADLKTPYFCVLDPDDYWCDDRKVQRALDFLESHPDFTIYTANSLMRGQGVERPYVAFDRVLDSDFDAYLSDRAAIGQTAGAIYRNVVFSQGLPEKLTGALRPDQEGTFRGDAFRNLIHLHEGRAHYEPECDAVYRLTDEGLWQGVSELKRLLGNVLLFLNMDEYYDYRHYGLHRLARLRYDAIGRKLPELAAAETDLEKMRALLRQYRDLGERLKQDDADDVRLERSLPFRQRLYRKAHAWLGQKGRVRGWA